MSSPALQIRPPQIDSPLTTLAQLANLRGVQTENLLRQQQIKQSESLMQEQQAQADQSNRDLADENTLKSGLSDPKVAAQVGKGDLSYFNGKVSPTNLLKFQEGVTKAHKEASLASVEDLKKNEAHAAQATESLFGLGQLPDDQAIASYPSVRQLLLDQGNVLAQHAPPTITSKKDLAKIEADLNLTAGINSKALALKGEQAKQDQERAAAAASNATAADKEFDLKLKQGALSGGSDAAIDARFAGNTDAAAAAKAAFKQNLPAGIDKATEAVNTVYANTIGAAQKIKSETPAKVAEQAAMLPGEVKKASAEAAATEPIRARANADAQAYLMKQTGGPLADILDPAERSKVGTEYLKAVDTYSEKAADADRLKQFVAAARSGNQSAAGLMTTAELRSIVNRVNTVELQKAGGAAILRKIENGLDSAGTGIPSEDTLKELEAVADLNDKTAQGAFGQKVRGIKVLSPKANLSEVPPGAKPAMVRARDPQGKLHEAPAGTPLPAGWKAE